MRGIAGPGGRAKVEAASRRFSPPDAATSRRIASTVVRGLGGGAFGAWQGGLVGARMVAGWELGGCCMGAGRVGCGVSSLVRGRKGERGAWGGESDLERDARWCRQCGGRGSCRLQGCLEDSENMLAPVCGSACYLTGRGFRNSAAQARGAAEHRPRDAVDVGHRAAAVRLAPRGHWQGAARRMLFSVRGAPRLDRPAGRSADASSGS